MLMTQSQTFSRASRQKFVVSDAVAASGQHGPTVRYRSVDALVELLEAGMQSNEIHLLVSRH